MVDFKNYLIALTFIMGTLACSGGLEQQSLHGDISFQGWEGPVIGGATIWLSVYEQSSDGTKGLLVAEHTERGVNMDSGTDMSHPFYTNIPPLNNGSLYLIDVHVDVDLDGVPSPGDAVSVNPLPLEGKKTLDPVVILVSEVK